MVYIFFKPQLKTKKRQCFNWSYRKHIRAVNTSGQYLRRWILLELSVTKSLKSYYRYLTFQVHCPFCFLILWKLRVFWIFWLYFEIMINILSKVQRNPSCGAGIKFEVYIEVSQRFWKSEWRKPWCRAGWGDRVVVRESGRQIPPPETQRQSWWAHTWAKGWWTC